MRSTINERLHFLNYAYFRVDDTEDSLFPYLFDYENNHNERLPENLILLAIIKAYGDLKRKVPYACNYSDMNRPENAELRAMKDSFKNEIHSYLVEQLAGFNYQEINITELISEVSNKGDNFPGLFRTNERFTIGLAQKWVNMTLKYLWILGAIDGERLHAPIDDSVIAAATLEGNGLCLGLEFNYQNNRNDSWISWNDITEYADFQDRIRTVVDNRFHISPIKWENDAWVAIENS